MSADVLIVVPTLGQRPRFLEQTLTSIRAQDIDVDIVIVGPSDQSTLQQAADRHGAALVPDPGSLAAAIEAGMARATNEHAFVSWLNDDDTLTPGSLSRTRDALLAQPRAVVAFGACAYVDDEGQLLWTSRAGHWAVRILGWGPDLIPQPGMLVRRSAWQAVGGLDPNLRFAFDLDLLLRLKQVGDLVNVGAVVSQFRWHATSLTVADRTASLNESEAVKRRYLSSHERRIAWSWEKPVRLATRLAAVRVNQRAKRLSDRGR